MNIYKCKCIKCECEFFEKWGKNPMCFSCFSKWNEIRNGPQHKLTEFWKGTKNDPRCDKFEKYTPKLSNDVPPIEKGEYAFLSDSD